MDPKDRLPAQFSDLDVPQLLRRLTQAGVDFVVVGGIAVILHGYPRLTRDLDIAFAPDPGNLRALGEVLVSLEAKLRGADEEVPFVPDERTLQGVELLTLTTSAGWLDIHKTLDGAPSYATLRRRADRVKLGDFSVLLASVDDMLAMKRAAGRPQDQVDIEALETIKRLRHNR
jgi:predicted nucleotidyltransferase